MASGILVVTISYFASGVNLYEALPTTGQYDKRSRQIHKRQFEAHEFHLKFCTSALSRNKEFLTTILR